MGLRALGSRSFVAIGLMGALAACVPGPGEDPEPGTEPDVAPSVEPGVEPEGEPDGILATAWNRDGEVGEIVDGATVPWVWGFQGGTMIRPAVILPDDGVVEVDDELYVLVSHAPNGDAPYAVLEEFQSVGHAAWAYVDAQGRLSVGPLDDQLSWSALGASELKLTIEVKRGTTTLYPPKTFSISIVEEEFEHACKLFGDVEPAGCSYVPLPGEVEFTAIDDNPNIPSCPDAIAVSGRFYPDPLRRDAIDACFENSVVYSPEAFDEEKPTVHPPLRRACAENAGVVVGQRLPAEMVIEAVGTCTPTTDIEWGLGLDACFCP